MVDKRKRKVSTPKTVGITRQDQRVPGEIPTRIQLAGTGVVVPVPKPRLKELKSIAGLSRRSQLSRGPKPGSK